MSGVEGSTTRDGGIALVVTYKVTKAIGQIVLAALGAILMLLGTTSRLEEICEHVNEHVTGAWSQRIAGAIVSASSHLWLVILALAVDGVLSSVEGWALYRRFRWAPWLVVVSTAALLPFEVVEIARAMRITRVVVLVVNVAIVLYLGRRALLHMRAGR